MSFRLVTNTAQWRIGDVFYLWGRGDTKFYIQDFWYHTGVGKWFCDASFTKERPVNEIDMVDCEVDDGLFKNPTKGDWSEINKE
jgi:hypothetical protein